MAWAALPRRWPNRRSGLASTLLGLAVLAVACDTDTAGISAIPVALTPAGGWTETPSPVLATCTEPLVAGAPDMRRTWEVVAVEAVESGCRGSARYHVAADVEHQRPQIRKRSCRSSRQPERVGADVQEGTARDSAPKLCVGQPNAVRLLS